MTEWLTVEEAADRLRIGRSLAYELTRRYLRTGGSDGIPCTRFGRLVRVPADALDALAERTHATRGWGQRTARESDPDRRDSRPR